MGDRTNCTLIVFGMTTKAAFEHIVDLCKDETFEEPNVWQFGEVNYAQLDHDVEAAIKDAGLSYIWLNENGGEYQSGVQLYDTMTKDSAEYQRCDLDLMISLREDFDLAHHWQSFLNYGMNAGVGFTS